MCRGRGGLLRGAHRDAADGPVGSTALKKFIRAGNLRVTTARGTTYTLGDGTGKPVAVRGSATEPPSAASCSIPSSSSAKSYMDGTLVVEQGSIADVLAVLLSPTRRAAVLGTAAPAVALSLRRLAQLNWRQRARRNVAHHYDLDDRLYSLFLDADRQYSCAYFETPDQSLDDAQLAKKRHLAAKLLLGPDQRVLDIGCGWGGLALYLAEICGAHVTGITLSRGAARASRARAPPRKGSAPVRVPPAGLSRRAGAVRPHRLGRHVRACRRRLLRQLLPQMRASCSTDDGVMLLHSIGRSEGPNVTNPWIAKYIFPGGYIPALSEVLPAVERAGSWSPTSRSCACTTPRR